jgi:hypothetical protein
VQDSNSNKNEKKRKEKITSRWVFSMQALHRAGNRESCSLSLLSSFLLIGLKAEEM